MIPEGDILFFEISALRVDHRSLCGEGRATANCARVSGSAHRLLCGGRSNASLSCRGNTTPSANSIACLIQSSSPACLFGTKDIATLVSDAVAGTTEEFTVAIVPHSTTGCCADDLTSPISNTTGVCLPTNHFSMQIGDTTGLGENLRGSHAEHADAD